LVLFKIGVEMATKKIHLPFIGKKDKQATRSNENKTTNFDISYSKRIKGIQQIGGTCKLTALANAEILLKRQNRLPVYANSKGKYTDLPVHEQAHNSTEKYKSLRQMAKQEIGSLQGEVLTIQDLTKLFRKRNFRCKTKQPKDVKAYTKTILQGLKQNKAIVAFYAYDELLLKGLNDNNTDPRQLENQEHAVVITGYNAKGDMIKITGISSNPSMQQNDKWVKIEDLYNASQKLTPYRQAEFYKKDTSTNDPRKYAILPYDEIDKVSQNDIDTQEIRKTKTPRQKTHMGESTGFQGKLLIADNGSPTANIIKQDYKTRKAHIQDKSSRTWNKAQDKLHVLTQKRSTTKSKQKEADDKIEQKASNIAKQLTNNIADEALKDSSVKTTANAYIEKDQAGEMPDLADVIGKALDDLIEVKDTATPTKHTKPHNEQGMLKLRKLAKKSLEIQYLEGDRAITKLNSTEMLELVDCIDVNKLNQQQQEKLTKITQIATTNRFNQLTPHKETNAAVYFLQKLPIKSGERNNQDKPEQKVEQYSKIAQGYFSRQKRSDAMRLLQTGAFVKLMEIGSTGNKNKRHTEQLTAAKKAIIDTIEQLENINPKSINDGQAKLSSFLKLASTPSFRQAMLVNNEMSNAVQQIAAKYKANPEINKELQTFQKNNFINGDVRNPNPNKDQEQIQAYKALFANEEQSQQEIQNWLVSGSKQYQKDIGKRINNRAIAQGLTPAILVGVLAGSTARLTIVKAAKVIPAIIVGTRVAFTLAVQSNGSIQQKIATYEHEVKNGQKANAYEKTKITAASLACPLAQGLSTGFALLGVKVAAVAGFTAAVGNPAGGTAVAAGFFGAIGTSLLAIGPLAKTAANREFTQSMLDDLM
jgi:hypothetical protein